MNLSVSVTPSVAHLSGYILLFVIFGGFFLFICLTDGWKEAVKVYGMTAALVAACCLIAWLVTY